MEGRIIEGPKKEFEVSKRTIGEFYFDFADKYAERIAQIDSATDEKDTYSSLKLKSVRVAIEMQKRGITSNDVVVCCNSNNLISTVPVLATSFLAAKIASLDPILSVRRCQHLLGLIEPKMIFVEETVVNLMEEGIKNLQHKPEIIVVGKSTKYSNIEEFLKPSPDEENFKPTIVDTNSVGSIFFSSGTTSLPKAICLSHTNLLHHMNECLTSNRPSSVSLTFTTLYWITANVFLLSAFANGRCRILVQKFSIDETFKIFQKYKVTFTLASAKVAYLLSTYPDVSKYDTSSLQNIIVGGGYTNEAILKNLRTIFPNAFVNRSYGMTETGIVTAFDENDRELMERKEGSCGKAAIRVAIKVVDPETNKLLPANQKGELRVKSTGLMVGYHKMDSSEVLDEDGFLKTGDVGYYDEDNCFYVVERLKEMFKYQGFHIIPSFLEAIILEHPAVIDSVVFGIPADEGYGEIPVAYVVLRPGQKATLEELREFYEQKVIDREKLRGGLYIVDAILKTPTGKPLRRKMREEFLKTRYNT